MLDRHGPKGLAVAAARKTGDELRRRWVEVRLSSRVKESGLADPLSEIGSRRLRSDALKFTANLALSGAPYGRYRYSEQQRDPVLYASAYAALIRHLLSDLDKLNQNQKKEWVSYLQSFQADDGLFRDAAIDNEFAESGDSWGWRHLTIHVLAALTALGGSAERSFSFMRTMFGPNGVQDWASSLDWSYKPHYASNSVHNVGTMLQYARDFQNDNESGHTLEQLLGWLDRNQDRATGLWGSRFHNRRLLSQGAQAAYHILLLYFYDKRPIPNPQRLVDSILSTQNRLGGFGTRPSSNACEDIDSIDPLARLATIVKYRTDDSQRALRRAIPWILANRNSDGGFVFFRGGPYTYGHPLMHTPADQSSLFATWFRMLSLAYIRKSFSDRVPSSTQWRFLDCPGYQFWKG